MIFGTLQTIFAFVITLGILVSIHEFGHFWVARRAGVKVLRFSIGFGKVLWRTTDRHGTEFTVSMIPLGGYVKMLDAREGAVTESEQDQEFTAKPVSSRIAIVAAGPISNFILAIVALWLMFMTGIKVMIPTVGEVVPDSPAAVAGIVPNEEVIAVNGVPTQGWQDVNMALISYAGESRTLTLTVSKDGHISDKNIAITDYLSDSDAESPLDTLGILPVAPVIPAVIGQVTVEGAAKRDGLQSGDKVLSVNGELIADWMAFVTLVQQSPLTPMDLLIERQGEQITKTITPNTRTANGEKVGFIGAGVAAVSMPEDLTRELHYGPIDAFMKGVESTWTLTVMTVDSLRKMVVGLISVKNLSGPVTIAKVASASLDSGLESYLYFLAMLSVSLGVLNLLPIPVLDGGHLMYYIVELVRGKPISEKVQMLGFKVGIAFVGGMMASALFNDLSRLAL